jgi:hypothetical protein
MSLPASKSDNRPIKTAARRRNIYPISALVLIGLGMILLADHLELLPAGWASFWPVLLILGGLFVLFTGRTAVGLPLPAFAIERGAYETAQLWLDSGLADVRLEAFAGSTQLAVGQFPDYAGPRLRAEGSQAQLILDHRASMPFLVGGWTLSLVKTLPWSLTVRSQVGHCQLNLRDLNITDLRLASMVGDIDLTLPANGEGEMELSLTFGDLILRVPEEMGVKIRLNASRLVNLRLENQRFIQTSADEWVTPNFSLSSQHYRLSITLIGGSLWVT